MSYNHPYRNPPDDFGQSHDMYTDSQRMYPRESGAYRSRLTRTASSDQTHSVLSSSASASESSVPPPGKALSFLQSCGLDTEDLKTLAELPEHLITTETLPDLLAEIKKKKSANASSSRSGALPFSSSARSWENRSQTQPVQYPLDLPVHTSYPKTWDDRWENVKQTSSTASTYKSPESNYVVEYNHLKDKDPYKAAYATEPTRHKSSVVSQSYTNYSKDVSQQSQSSSRDISQSSRVSSRDITQSSRVSGRDISQSSSVSSRDISQPSYLSSRDISQSSHVSSRDISQSLRVSSRDISQSSSVSSRDISQPSYLSSRDVSQPSYLSRTDISQPSLLSSKDISQPSYLSSRDNSQSSHLSSRDGSLSSRMSSRDISQPSRLSSKDIIQPSYLSSRDNSQSLHMSSRDINQPSYLSSRDISQPSYLSSREVSQPSYLSSREISQPSYLSSRDLRQSSRVSSSDISQPSHHHRKETVHRVPTRKEASDFHGKTPPVFPYACILCEITVLSKKDWSVHTTGAQHANSQLILVERYPEWNQKIESARRNDPLPKKPQPRSTQKRVGTTDSKSRLSTSKSESSSKVIASSNNLNKTTEIDTCTVVSVKFQTDDVDEAYLKKCLGQFGVVVKIIMFPNMAFVEMGSKDQAGDIVKYFSQNPLTIKGHPLRFSLSAAFSFLKSSRVVTFLPLPAGDGVRCELIAIAKRFGSVKCSLYLPSRFYVEMVDTEDADRLVEYYSTNSLKLKGKTIQVSFSSEYQTLGSVDTNDEKPLKSSSRRRSSSPRRRSRNSRRDSPIPKRRASDVRSRSRRSTDSRKRDNSRHSREKSREKSRRGSSSKDHSKNSTSKDKTTKTEESKNDEGKSDADDVQSDTMDNESDLEGVAVIADDGEELNSEDELEVNEEDDQTCEQESSEDMQDMEQLNDETAASDVEMETEHAEIEDHVSNTENESSISQEERQEKEEEEKDETVEMEEELSDFLDSLENCITLDEFQDDMLSDEDVEEEDSAPSAEEACGRVLRIRNLPQDGKYTDLDFRSIAEPYGKVMRQWIFRLHRTGLIEMENASDAQKVVAAGEANNIAICGQFPKITVSTKHTNLNKKFFLSGPSDGTVSAPEELKSERGESQTDNVSEQLSVQSEVKTEDVSEHLSVPSENKTEDVSEHLSVPSENKTEDVSEHLSVPSENKTEDVSEHLSFSSENKTEDVSEHLSVSSKNKADVSEHLSVPFENKTEDVSEHLSVSSENKADVSEHLSVSSENKADVSEQLSVPSENKAEDVSEQLSIQTENKSEKVSVQTPVNVKESSNDNQDGSSNGKAEHISDTDDDTKMMKMNSNSTETQTQLQYDIAGTEFVRPVVGYFCSLCNAIYASEEEAKTEHCRTPLHHQKLKEHMEQKNLS